MKISTYLLFAGNAEEVINFYQSVFGGKITGMSRFGDTDSEKMKKMPLSEADMKKIMHATLDIKGELVMFSDAMSAMESGLKVGTNCSICVNPDSKEEADKFFSALSVGGNIKMPMHDAFWGSYFGMLTDKYEINWLINYGLFGNKAAKLET